MAANEPDYHLLAEYVVLTAHREQLDIVELQLKRYMDRLIDVLRQERPEEDAPAPAPRYPRTNNGILRAARIEALMAALAAARWNKCQAAKLLGINTKTIYNWLRTFGITEKDTAGVKASRDDVRPWNLTERDIILDRMAVQRGNKESVARELGITPKTLYYKLTEYGAYSTLEGDLVNWRNGKTAERKT